MSDANSVSTSTGEAALTQTTSNALSYKDHLSEKLRLAINKEQMSAASAALGVGSSNWESEIKATLKCELAIYERSNILGKNLQTLLSALNGIQPTSTECERVFSLSSRFCTKIRSRLSDKSLNNLCFLKSYLIRNKKD